MPMLTYGEIMEAAEALPLEQRRELGEALLRRVADARRQELALEAAQAEEDFRAGRCRIMSPTEFAAELAK